MIAVKHMEKMKDGKEVQIHHQQNPSISWMFFLNKNSGNHRIQNHFWDVWINHMLVIHLSDYWQNIFKRTYMQAHPSCRHRSPRNSDIRGVSLCNV